MKYIVYALQNAFIGAYDLPVISQAQPDDMIEGYRRLIVQEPDRAYSTYVHEKTLCIIGEFDDITGVLVPCQPKKIKEIAALFPAGYLAKKESESKVYFDGLKKGDSNGNPAAQN